MSNYMTPIFHTDFYKTGHQDMYPPGTEVVYSNFTPRSGKHSNVKTDGIVNFGSRIAMYLLHKQWEENFFGVPKEQALKPFKDEVSLALNTDYNVDRFEALYDLGYLPVHVKTLPEGEFVPYKTPVLTIQNTLPEFYWLTNYLETSLSSLLWRPMTSATTAHHYASEFNLSLGDPEAWQFSAHDFSYRGMDNDLAAAISGAAHLLFFRGTDTIPAIPLIREAYNVLDGEFIGGSVPATEHSVMSAWGPEDEFDLFKRLITEVYPSGIVSIVSDTWDLWKVLADYLPHLKDEIETRDGKTVIRPDCYADGTEILTENGFKDFNDLTPADKVAQVHDDETVDYVKPSKIIAEDYEGEMIRFFNEHRLDITVTPNHRMVRKNFKTGKLSVIEASKAKFYHQMGMLRGAENKVDGPKLTPYERFLIAFQADGSYPSGWSKVEKPGSIAEHCRTRFTFTKNRKLERLKEICEMSGLEYSIHEEEARPNQVVVYVNVPLNFVLSKTFDWVLPEKRSSEWNRQFIYELSHWDATRRSEDRFKYDTTVYENADAVQRASILAGYGCTMSRFPDERKEHFSDVWSCTILTHNKIGGQGVESEIIKYKGRIHCVTVPSGKIVVRNKNKTLVSGNSGDPLKIICGDPDAALGSPEGAGALELLWDTFGGTTDAMGYRTLNPKVGLIYGDSITPDLCTRILERTEEIGFKANCLVLGVGSYTYGMVTRDTHGFAMKATAAKVNGEWREIFKDPVTDDGTKKSLRGLIHIDDYGNVADGVTEELEQEGMLQTLYRDGYFSNNLPTWEEVRKKALESL